MVRKILASSSRLPTGSAALMLALFVGLSGWASATTISTYEAVPTSVTGAGTITGNPFSTIPNLSSTDYADASQGHGVTLTFVGDGTHDSLAGGSLSNLTDGHWQSSSDARRIGLLLHRH